MAELAIKVEPADDYFARSCECGAEMVFGFVLEVTCAKCGRRYHVDHYDNDEGEAMCDLIPVTADGSSD